MHTRRDILMLLLYHIINQLSLHHGSHCCLLLPAAAANRTIRAKLPGELHPSRKPRKFTLYVSRHAQDQIRVRARYDLKYPSMG